jgi:hypothetical protein
MSAAAPNRGCIKFNFAAVISSAAAHSLKALNIDPIVF